MMDTPETLTDPTPAALYARVSSDRQDVDLSVASQLRALRDYARKNGYIVAREYVDEAGSGHIADRPEFRKMIDEATKPDAPFGEILVWKFSRFTRKREHAVAFKFMLRRKGVRVVSITEHADNTPTGKLMEAIIESVDEFYSENLVQALRFGGRQPSQSVQQIGKYGMGLPTASVSQCRRLDVWTWDNGIDQCPHSYIDIEEIEEGTQLEVPEPDSCPVPREWLDMVSLGTLNPEHGTLVVWSDPDRIVAQSRTIFDQVEEEVGRIYRRYIYEDELSIRMASFRLGESVPQIDRDVRPNDPMYIMEDSSTPVSLTTDVTRFSVEDEGSRACGHSARNGAAAHSHGVVASAWSTAGQSNGRNDMLKRLVVHGTGFMGGLLAGGVVWQVMFHLAPHHFGTPFPGEIWPTGVLVDGWLWVPGWVTSISNEAAGLVVAALTYLFVVRVIPSFLSEVLQTCQSPRWSYLEKCTEQKPTFRRTAGRRDGRGLDVYALDRRRQPNERKRMGGKTLEVPAAGGRTLLAEGQCSAKY